MMNGSIKVRYLLVAVLGLTLASCGTVYRTPEVVEGVAGGTNVRVMNLTAESVIQANRSAYAPRSLPDVFSRTAGSGSGLRGTGALPSQIGRAHV